MPGLPAVATEPIVATAKKITPNVLIFDVFIFFLGC